MMNKTLFSALAGFILTATASAAPLNAIHTALADIDRQARDVYLIGYQSVEHAHADQFGASKYIVLDFRADNRKLAEEEALSKVEVICGEIIRNRTLLSDLSEMGYDMISVAFDDASQFDCL